MHAWSRAGDSEARPRRRRSPAICRSDGPADPARAIDRCVHRLTTCCASSRVKPPANTPRRRNAVCSSADSRPWLHSSAARSVWCRRSFMRVPPVSTLNIWLSRACRPCTPSSGTRAAASSMASGMPSNRRHMSTTTSTLSSASRNRESTACARSTNSATAPNSGGLFELRARRYRQRSEPIDLLVATLQRFLRGHEQPYVRCTRAQQVDQRGDVIRKVLAVVEHQQQALGSRAPSRALPAAAARQAAACRAPRRCCSGPAHPR